MLRWSLASLLVLASAGGVLALSTPGIVAGRFTDASREVVQALARALLEGSLPDEAVALDQALTALLERTEALVAGLPAHAQAELSQLLALLTSSAGRRWLAGIEPSWADASVAQVQAGLAEMRRSSLSLRLQAYQALHDVVGSAYFSDPSTWAVLGYPGPRVLAEPTAPAA